MPAVVMVMGAVLVVVMVVVQKGGAAVSFMMSQGTLLDPRLCHPPRSLHEDGVGEAAWQMVGRYHPRVVGVAGSRVPGSQLGRFCDFNNILTAVVADIRVENVVDEEVVFRFHGGGFLKGRGFVTSTLYFAEGGAKGSERGLWSLSKV
jgi:hypothetical protein